MAKSTQANSAKASDINGMLGAMGQSNSMNEFIREIKSQTPSQGLTDSSAPEPTPPPSPSTAQPVVTTTAIHVPAPKKTAVRYPINTPVTDEENDSDLSDHAASVDRQGVPAPGDLVAQTAEEFCAMNLQMKSLAGVGMKHIFITSRLHNILLMLAEYTNTIGTPVPMQTILDNVLTRYFKANEKALRTINRRNQKSREDRFDL